MAEAQRDMENVHFEKKQLVSVWKSSLVYLQQKDETLQRTEASLRQQSEKALTLQNENGAAQRRISDQQVQRRFPISVLSHRSQASNEQTESLILKIESDSNAVSSKISDCVAQRDAFEQTLAQVDDQVRDVNAQLESAHVEARRIEEASETQRKRYVKVDLG